jgi:xeroderma pigmentosum group C-complementing protein
MKAAKHLKIDYVQVVMGFKREGGNTVPNFNGILVADRFVDSVVQTGEGLEALAAQEAARKRRQKVLLRWSTLVRQLQTKSHVANQFGGGGGGGKSGSSSSSADVQVERM